MFSVPLIIATLPLGILLFVVDAKNFKNRSEDLVKALLILKRALTL